MSTKNTTSRLVKSEQKQESVISTKVDGEFKYELRDLILEKQRKGETANLQSMGIEAFQLLGQKYKFTAKP